jgi:DNA-binding phage protein
MAKTKTLQKQKKSLESTSNHKLKSGTGITPYSPTEEILQGDLIGRAIVECLRNNDPEGVMEVISIYLNTLNRVKTAQQANIPRSTLYHSLKYKNPTIKTLAKIISAQSITQAKK